MIMFVTVAVLHLTSSSSYADRRSYVWTYEYLTLPKGQAELEHYQTLKLPDMDNKDIHVWEHRVELEYGITDRLDIAIYQIFEQKNGENFQYSAFQFRTRYRLFEAGYYFVTFQLPDGSSRIMCTYGGGQCSPGDGSFRAIEDHETEQAIVRLDGLGISRGYRDDSNPWLAPEEITVRVEAEDGTLLGEETFRPEYEEYYPNGKECDKIPCFITEEIMIVDSVPTATDDRDAGQP